MQCLGPIGMDCAINESCYKGTILERNYRIMTNLWSISYDSFLKFHLKKLDATSWTYYNNRVMGESSKISFEIQILKLAGYLQKWII